MQEQAHPTVDALREKYAHIKGWGIDADPKNDPTYPMRRRENDDHEGYSWERPTQQPTDIEVLHSNERPNVTAVFGTSAPPSGLSGLLRRYAFRYGEGSIGHWIPLILADRVDVVEGIVKDVLHGRVPNIFAERGIKAQWKYDRGTVIRDWAVGAVLVGAAALLLLRRDRD